MDFETAMDPMTVVSRAEARKEIRAHSGSHADFTARWDDFTREQGDRAEYRARDVLVWLGY